MLFIVVFMFCAVSAHVLNEGDVCTVGDVTGVCTILDRCKSALDEIKNRKHPQICSFKSNHPVVCCVNNISVASELEIDYYDYESRQGCDPVNPLLTANKTGHKAFDKCIEYQEDLVYPCIKNTAGGEYIRKNACNHNSKSFLIENDEVLPHEFSHMALLGYGNDSRSLVWLCAGALISDRFILTAAHCTSSREYGRITYAALNTLNRENIDPKNVHKVKNIINHPDFQIPKIYHDIALLELETPLKLNSFTVPACLHTGEPVSVKAFSTSWNTHDVLGTNSKVLKRIHLSKFTDEECSEFYPVTRKGKFNETTHVCFGDRGNTKDFCEDDGGSPVVAENQKIHCMHTILGITSRGKGCLNHSPGLYTKLDYYVPWIESIVWP